MPEAARLRRTSNVLFLVAGILLGVAVVVTFSMLYLPGAYMSMGNAQRMVPVFIFTQTLTLLIPPISAAAIVVGIVLRALTVRVELRRTVSLVLVLVGALLLVVAIVFIGIGQSLPAGIFPPNVLTYMIMDRLGAILRVLLPAIAAGTLIAGTVLVLLQPKQEGAQSAPSA